MYLTPYEAPSNRKDYVVDGIEQRLTEPAVMLAFAMYLLDHPQSNREVTVCPDGEHAKIFDIINFMHRKGYTKTDAIGSKDYAGRYQRENFTLIINPTSGKGDVIGTIGNRRIIAECKGGIVNTKHPGQQSRLRKGLSELIGQLMLLPVNDDRQVAVLPYTESIKRLALKMLPRVTTAGIEIALVHTDGRIDFIKSVNG